MEFVEEESRPRFLLHSRSPAASDDPGSPALSKPHAAACVAAAAILLFSAFYFPLQSQTLVTVLVWAAVSLLIGPFAPSCITGGDVRIGLGEPLEPRDPDPSPEEEAEEPRKRNPGRRSKARRSEEPLPSVGSVPPTEKKREQRNGVAANTGDGAEKGEVEEREWNDEDFEILKKQIAKHPVGTPKRWERIAEAFGGRHGVESVIRTAKSLQEKRPGAGDSFSQFLRQRKPIDKRAEVADPELSAPDPSENGEAKDGDANGGGGGSWSSGEDIALLNALKVFPKDAPMRWEKIAAAVPGRSKAACMRRVTELKRDFRSMKASEA
ncbi:hypothetical protein Taro_020768 [Colocasia esculenta]|uniref:Myb-like domain-containing protein n=1 Tax=Colocasia esculenta TaxID=4460 RepID=A0A843V3C9_COLES|nr:hypothetical protein [Colocasia esculenta]